MISTINLGPITLTFVIVVGTTGLCGMTAWSQGQRSYVTVSVGSEPLHKTTIAENVGELEWNDTFQL
jgi:hypothetical protein